MPCLAHGRKHVANSSQLRRFDVGKLCAKLNKTCKNLMGKMRRKELQRINAAAPEEVPWVIRGSTGGYPTAVARGNIRDFTHLPSDGCILQSSNRKAWMRCNIDAVHTGVSAASTAGRHRRPHTGISQMRTAVVEQCLPAIAHDNHEALLHQTSLGHSALGFQGNRSHRTVILISMLVVNITFTPHPHPHHRRRHRHHRRRRSSSSSSSNNNSNNMSGLPSRPSASPITPM